MRNITIYVALWIFVVSCKPTPGLLEIMPHTETGIGFNNEIIESDTLNILSDDYLYNGGGVGIGDFDKNGLPDVFFSGNIVGNKLYLNSGGFHFKDITVDANVGSSEKWNSGVCVVDINDDGWDDIYVCATFWKDSTKRENSLFINQGLNDKGVPWFLDLAKQYGLADNGFSTQSSFFDYDHDGDLDVYILTNVLSDKRGNAFRNKITDGSAENTDRLYQNNGNGTFTDVSKTAGIVFEGYGLGLRISDINRDGWLDIYVCNDYISNDLLYLNNGNGTFTNKIGSFLKHQSLFSMGVDIADINNDGFQEIMTLDMLPRSNSRMKTTVGGNSYVTYIHNQRFGYEHQYIRNTLHLNNGTDKYETIYFSDVSFLAGVAQSEWSWSTIMADMDNDGHKDILITNGFPKDVTDKDFGMFRSTFRRETPWDLLKAIPEVKVSNLIFKNSGDLNFIDVTDSWSVRKPSFSNGAAIVDLDLDGDLDYVVNNINDRAFIYKNNLNFQSEVKQNYFRVKFKSSDKYIGAEVQVFLADGELRVGENSKVRGYLSSVENILHFGVGKHKQVDSIVIRFQGLKGHILGPLPVNQVFLVDDNLKLDKSYSLKPPRAKVYDEVSQNLGIEFTHEEEDYIDFNVQRTLPHKFSQMGPAIAISDIDNDGLEDIILGGSNGHSSVAYLQNFEGKFSKGEYINKVYSNSEDAGIALFDLNNDKLPDLYVVSGSIEAPKGDRSYQDRFYWNRGKGKFEYDASVIVNETISGSCVRVADVNSDQRLDLFVGSSISPGRYPESNESMLLLSDGNKLINHGTQWLEASDLGIVKDAIFSDLNGDLKPDLIVVGEFMGVKTFINKGNKFEEERKNGVSNQIGWWNSIKGSDLDLDGDVDFILGNRGRNSLYNVTDDFPLVVTGSDIDFNGSIDAVIGGYFLDDNEKMDLFPVNFWEELSSQSPKFRNRFSNFKDFSNAGYDKIFSKEEIKKGVVLKANQMSSGIVENLGGGVFKFRLLPVEAQIFPVYGIELSYSNNDLLPDIFLVGNDYGNEVFTGRLDAGIGLVLENQGDLNFRTVPVKESGFYVHGDSKALAKAIVKDEVHLIASQNRDRLKIFKMRVPNKSWYYKPQFGDIGVEFFTNGKSKGYNEIFLGGGYYSQSTNILEIPWGIDSIRIRNQYNRASVIKRTNQ